jgi:hypothetical protein
MEQRTIINYSNDELLDITDDIDVMKIEIKKLERNGGTSLFENQIISAHQIITNFQNRKIINQMVLGRCQSGKTGCMLACIKLLLYNPNNIIPIDNIYIITGLSSLDWKIQTMNRLPRRLERNVFHRGDLMKRFISSIQNKKNIIIFLDEVHLASQEEQTIHKSFINIGLLNKDYLIQNDIKILEFTATPDGTLYDLMKWGENSCKVMANPGNFYTGSDQLYLNKQIKQYQDLCGSIVSGPNEIIKKNVAELVAEINKFNNFRYHIIRTGGGDRSKQTQENINNYICENNLDHLFEYFEYNEISIDSINNRLIIEPLCHTIIYIKEKLRCSQTLVKLYLGICYERCTRTVNDSTIIQGLLGRLNGYDTPTDCICYTNIPSLLRYEKIWNSNFNDKSLKWFSRTTTRENNLTTSKRTFNGDISGFNIDSLEVSTNTNRKLIIIKKKTQHEIMVYFDLIKNDIFKNRNCSGPKYIKLNDDGYYKSNIAGNKKIWSCKELFNIRHQGLNHDSKYRYYACYEDINNKSTVEFWLIYYEIE